MKRFVVLFALFLLCAACASAEPVTGLGLTFDSQDTYIDFGKVKVGDHKADRIIALLDALPNLEKADMFEGYLSNSTMDMLCERYPQVDFGWTVRVGNHALRTDATAFSTLHDPEKSAPHNSKAFYALKFCKKLKALDLGHNIINDISFLLEHKDLKVLILACNYIRDISVLAELTQLEYLELFTNNFTDITPLSNLTSLRDLNLSNNAITDLTPLYNLPNLERFRLSMNNRITDEQKAEFEARYPDVIIGWNRHPTAEGWREHPNYDVIYRIFHTDVYEPFATREQNKQLMEMNKQ